MTPRSFSHWASAVFLVGASSLLACMPAAQQPQPPHLERSSYMPGPGLRAEYDLLCDAGDRAESAPNDPALVRAYADELLAVEPGFRANIEDVEWQARTARASELMGGVITQLDESEVSSAWFSKGLLGLHARGDQDPGVEADFQKAHETGRTWETGTALVELYSRRRLPGVTAIDACETTYDAGKREKRDYQDFATLIRACKSFVVGGKEPLGVYTNVEPEYWDELRKLAETSP